MKVQTNSSISIQISFCLNWIVWHLMIPFKCTTKASFNATSTSLIESDMISFFTSCFSLLSMISYQPRKPKRQRYLLLGSKVRHRCYTFYSSFSLVEYKEDYSLWLYIFNGFSIIIINYNSLRLEIIILIIIRNINPLLTLQYICINTKYSYIY